SEESKNTLNRVFFKGVFRRIFKFEILIKCYEILLFRYNQKSVRGERGARKRLPQNPVYGQQDLSWAFQQCERSIENGPRKENKCDCLSPMLSGQNEFNCGFFPCGNR